MNRLFLQRALPRWICGSQRRAGFTLIELMTVMAIIAILAALLLPAVTYLNGRKFDGSVQEIAALMNLARETARSNNTYTWVLFYPSTPPGQLTLVAVESKDGTDPINWGTYSSTVPDGNLDLLARPLTLSQINLADVGSFDAQVAGLPSPTAKDSNALNSAISVPVNVPNRGVVTFRKAIRYLPSNGAGNNIPLSTDVNATFVELDLQPIRGTALNTKDVAVVRVDKASAALQIYNP